MADFDVIVKTGNINTNPTTFLTTLASSGTSPFNFGGTGIVAATHGGVTGTLAAGDAVEKSSDTSQTATIRAISETHVIFEMGAGDSFTSADVIQKVGATGNNITLSSTPAALGIITIKMGETFNAYMHVNTVVSGTSSTKYVVITSEVAHAGVQTATGGLSYNGAQSYVVQLQDHCDIKDTIIDYSTTTGARYNVLYRGNCEFTNVFFRTLSTSGTNVKPANGGYTPIFKRCVFFGSVESFNRNGANGHNFTAHYCNFIQCTTAIGTCTASTNNLQLIGCLFIGNGTDIASGWTNSSSNYNGSSYASGSTNLASFDGGNNVYSLVGSTIFVNYDSTDTDWADGDDWNLTNTTPPVDSAQTSAYSSTIDITGYTITGTADIGAYEYQSGGASFTGTGAGTLTAITGSGSGTFYGLFTGTAAGTLSAITGSASGESASTGTAEGTLVAITGDGSGWVENTGTASGTLAAITGSADGSFAEGSERIGVGAGTLTAITGAGSGWIEITGDGAGLLTAITGSGVGTFSGAFTASGAGSLAAIVGDASGWIEITGTGAGTLQAITGAARESSGTRFDFIHNTLLDNFIVQTIRIH